MTGPIRALIGDADRDRYIALLREHYAAGRLSMEELERRVEIVLSAGYADEAVAALADLPPGEAGGMDSFRKQGGSGGRPVRGKGHGHANEPAVGWVPTAERFRDPSSGVIMRVWVDPADDSRHYVPDR